MKLKKPWRISANTISIVNVDEFEHFRIYWRSFRQLMLRSAKTRSKIIAEEKIAVHLHM